MTDLPSDDVFQAYLNQAIAQLRALGVIFEAGLTDDEVQGAEQRYQIQFPPDLRQFLQIALPVATTANAVFPNWRSANPEIIQDIRWRLQTPVEWLADEFTLEEHHFWLPGWDAKPQNLADALEYVRQKVRAAPRLIPLIGHRFMPQTPHQAGNPVFSMYGDDTIYYGFDLADYLHKEFRISRPEWAASRPRRYIPFWENLVADNDGGRAPQTGYAEPLEKDM
jgi:hypothetical protein